MNSTPDISAPDVDIALRGDIDLAVLVTLPYWLSERFRPAGGHFNLDLTRVTFLDCSGFRLLLAIQDYTEASGGGVRLTGTSPPVTRLLELLELPEGSSFLAPATTDHLTGPVAQRDVA